MILLAQQRVPTVLVTLMIALIPITVSVAQDVVVTRSGDHLAGEIKSLKHGWITFEADYGDNDFIIDWDEIRYLESQDFFTFRTTDGQRFTGSFRTDPADSSYLLIKGPQGSVAVHRQDLVEMENVETSFWDQLSASFDFGYSLTKANNLRQTTLGGKIGYRSERSYANISLQGVNSAQDNADRSRKGDLNLRYSYLFLSNWYAVASAGFETSDEQQLDLRSTVGGGVGAILLSTQRMDMTLSAGIGYVNERFLGSDLGSVNSAEAFGKLEFNAFDIGDLSLLTEASVYPSLTQKGRVRSKVTADSKWDLPLSLTFKLSFTFNYDTKPPNEATKSDYVFSSTVGWEL